MNINYKQLYIQRKIKEKNKRNKDGIQKGNFQKKDVLIRRKKESKRKKKKKKKSI